MEKWGGGREKKGIKKRTKLCYVHGPTPHNEYNIRCYEHVPIKKNQKLKQLCDQNDFHSTLNKWMLYE